AVGVRESIRLYRARVAFRIAQDKYFETGRNPGPETRQRLQHSIDLSSGDPDPHYLLGRIASREQRHVEAVEHLRNAIRVNPFDGRAHYYLGRAFWNLRKEEEASLAMETAARLSRNNPDHQYEIGYFFWFIWETKSRSPVADFRAAFAILKKAFRYFRAAAEGNLKYLTRVLELTQKWGIIYSNLEDVIPDMPEAHAKAGHYFGHKRGLWGPARKEFEKAGDAFENRADFLFDRGLALLFSREDPLPDPLPDFRNSVKRSPDPGPMLRRLSFYFRTARRIDEGLAFWSELEEEYPHLPALAINTAENRLNQIKEEMQEKMKALTAERKAALARAMSPAEREITIKLYADKAKSAWREALKDLEAYMRERLTVFPESAELWRLMAELLWESWHFEESENAFRHAAELGNLPAYWIHYIRFLMHRKKYEEAWKKALHAKGRYPENKEIANLAEEALKRRGR
ncbi:MAG: tetratricopeptide repeat protein, partial [Planctomycetota bacterium]